MATADRERRRAEISQEVERRFLAKRDHHEVVGRGDARFHVLIDMLLDTQDDVRELIDDVNRIRAKISSRQVDGKW
jgi:hypothetical protein